MTSEPPARTLAPERDDDPAGDGAATLATRSRTNRLFGSRAFARLWAAQVVSATGDWLGLVAITALADRLGGSYAGASIGLVLAARIVPGFFLAPLAGVIADRWDRKRLMVTCDLGRAGVMLMLPFVDSIAGLVLASLLLEVLTLLWAPAKEATVPNLVPRRSLTNANSLSMIAAYATFPIGAALFTMSAKLASLFDGVSLAHTLRLDKSGLAFVFDAVTFAVSATLIAGLPLGGRRASDPRAGSQRRFDAGATLRDLREGWRFVVVDPVVRAVNCGLATGLIGGGMLIPLGALFARDVLASGEAGYGVLVTALGVGVAFGVTGVSVLQRRVSKQWLFTTSVLSGGVALVLAASMSRLAAAALAVGVLGLCAGTVYVVGFTLLHEHVADDLRGRIFASLYTLVRFCLLLAMTTGPLLSELLDHASMRWWHRHVELAGIDVALPGVRLTLWLAGVIIMFAGWLAVVSLRAGERQGGPAQASRHEIHAPALSTER